VYRVIQPGAPDSDEEHDVQRPFLGRLEMRRGSSVFVGSLSSDQGTWLYVAGERPGWAQLTSSRDRAAGDSHVGAGLAEALRQRLARVVGRRTVAGQACTVVRTGSPIASKATRPTAGDHDDLCVDAHGIMLEDQWTIKGTLARTRVATTYDPSPTFTDQTWAPTPSSSNAALVRSKAPRVVELDAAGIGRLALALDPPSGYSATGGYYSQPSASVLAGDSVEHFVDGPDLIDLTQHTVQGPANPRKGRRVKVPGVGTVTIHTDLSTVSVEAQLPGGAYARLSGSDVETLLAAARGLRPTRR